MAVLQFTMEFLLQEVADCGEDGRWGDWFDYLWNRTRGIRKVQTVFWWLFFAHLNKVIQFIWSLVESEKSKDFHLLLVQKQYLYFVF